MELYEEIVFASRLGVYLRNFKQKKPRLWEFSHSCEKDRGSGKYKSRAYIYQAKDSAPLNVYCHHCGLSISMGNFIKDINPSLYNEYRLAAYKNNEPEHEIVQPIEEPAIDINLNGLVPVTTLPKSSSVLKFINARKIPQKHFKLLYVAKHFYPWASFYNKDFKGLPDVSPRLVFPYFNKDKKLIGFTARTFNPKIEPRYIHMRLDKKSEFIYGVDRLKFDQTIYVTEGNIDSLFIDNAIAIGGANYDKEFLQMIKDKAVIIPDQDWKRNPQVAKQLKKAIDRGFSVCFLPDTVRGKDLNDVVKTGIDTPHLKELIDSNVASGLRAQLEFGLMKRCVI